MNLILIEEDYVNDANDIVGTVFGSKVPIDNQKWKTFILERLNYSDYAEHVIKNIESSTIKTIGILENIHVHDSYQGQGIGTELMNLFMQATLDCEAIVLIADLKQNQKMGFNLTNWYEEYNFIAYCHTEDFSLMILDKNNYLDNLLPEIMEIHRTKNKM